MFSDFELEPRSEVYQIYAADHPAWSSVHRFAHPVRVVGASDRSEVVELMMEVYGRVDERWLGSFRSGREECFAVDGGGGLAGVGWASVVNGHGRLHSLSVRARYRRTGVGRDLFYARMGWTRQAEAIAGDLGGLGAQCRLPEDRGVRGDASRSVEDLPFVSRVIAHAGPAHVLGAPQTGQTVAVESIRVPQ